MAAGKRNEKQNGLRKRRHSVAGKSRGTWTGIYAHVSANFSYAIKTSRQSMGVNRAAPKNGRRKPIRVLAPKKPHAKHKNK
jgi:hypothetical protein